MMAINVTENKGACRVCRVCCRPISRPVLDWCWGNCAVSSARNIYIYINSRISNIAHTLCRRDVHVRCACVRQTVAQIRPKNKTFIFNGPFSATVESVRFYRHLDIIRRMNGRWTAFLLFVFSNDFYTKIIFRTWSGTSDFHIELCKWKAICEWYLDHIWCTRSFLDCSAYNRSHQCAHAFCSHHYYVYSVCTRRRRRRWCVFAGVCVRLGDVATFGHTHTRLCTP